MAQSRRLNHLAFLGMAGRGRRDLLRSTALRTAAVLIVAFPAAAAAQPAPNARPVGGVVVGGQATISQSAAQTTITQATQNAAINWQGFDVGANQAVTFQQPSAAAVALNRVVSPDPTQIAGRISANGQVIVVNQSGIFVDKGARIETAGLVLSAADITNRNFMAGRMDFNIPGKADAKIENDGTLSVRQHGLAALVAPQVANNGVITAKMGHVVLAGAETQTVDLYGDGLLSINVTGQVRTAPVGPDGKPVTALVTNTGVVRADGGTVVLTAKAVDGLVQNLVDAGGRISASTAGGQTGTVVVSGIGGSVRVAGAISASGRAAGEAGGQIALNATDTVTVAKGARVTASGTTAGGTIAVGTTLARAAGGRSVTAALTARNTTIEAGARISANGRGTGNGGRVAVLSTNATTMAGTISAGAGKQGGNGGTVEVSGNGALSLTGTVRLAAPHGAPGTIVIDPDSLDFEASGSNVTPNATGPTVAFGDSPAAATIDSATVAMLDTSGANLLFQANTTITVNVPITLANAASFGLQSGGGIAINRSLNAGPANVALTAAGAVTFNAPVTVTGSGGSVLTINAGSIIQSATGVISASNLTGGVTAGATALGTATNNIVNLGAFTAPNGDLVINNGSNPLSILDNVTVGAANTLSLTAGAIAQTGGTISAGTLLANATGSAPGAGSVALQQSGNNVRTLGASGATNNFALIDGTLQNGTLQTGNPLTIGGPVNVGTSTLSISAGAITQLTGQTPAAAITAGTFTGVALGAVSLTEPTNAITNLGPFSASGSAFTLVNGAALNIVGQVSGSNVTITAPSLAVTAAGAIGACDIGGATGNVVLTANTGTIAVNGGTIGGQTSTTLAAPGGVSVSAGVVDAGIAANSGSVAISTGLTLTGGSVFAGSVAVTGPVTQSGGTLAAQNLTTGAYGFSGGSVLAGNALTIDASALPAGSEIVSSGGDVTVVGQAGLTTTAATIASADTVRLQLAGSITQTGGLIAAGSTVIIGGTGGDTSALPGTIAQSGGTIASGTLVRLYALPTSGGTAMFAGTLASGTVQVLEPGAGVTFAPATLAGASTPGGLAFTLTPHCPSCDLNTPGIAGGPVSASIGGVPGTLRLDGATLAIDTAIAAGVVELHATGDTTQTAAGVITAGTLDGTAGYAATLLANSLPTYDATTVTPATVALDTAANNVSVLGPYYAGGDIRLNDTGLIANGPALTAGGTIAPSQRLTVDDRVVAGGAAPATAGITLTAAGVTVDAGAGNAGLLSFGTVTGGAFVTQTRPVTPGAGTFTASTVPATSTDFDTITLQTDRLQLTSAGTTPIVSAPGGVVAIAPLTAGRTLSIDATRDENTLSLVNAELGTLVTTLGGAAGPQTLRLGSLDGVTAVAGGLTFNASLDLTDTAGTLGLFTTGDVTEAATAGVSIGRVASGPNAAVTGVITGLAGGQFSLFSGAGSPVVPLNSFDVLRNVAAGTSIAVNDIAGPNAGRSGMTVEGTIGPVSAASGFDITLSDAGATFGGTRLGGTLQIGAGAVAGTIEATGGTLTLAAINGAVTAAAMTETASSRIVADHLTGSASSDATGGTGYDVLLIGNNSIGTLDAFTVGTLAGSLLTAQGGFTLDSAGMLTIASAGTAGVVAANNVMVTADTVSVTGAVGACDIGGATGNVVLTANTGTIAVNGGTIGGQTSTTVAAPGGVSVSAGVVDSGIAANSGSVAISTGLTLTGGSVFAGSVTVTGPVTQSGGTLAAQDLTTGGYGFSGGSVLAGNALTIDASALPAGSEIVSSGGDVTVIGQAGLTTTAATIASADTVRLQLAGSITQTGGLIAAGSTVIIGGTGGDTSALPGTIAQSGGTIASGTLVRLYAIPTSGGTAMFAGTLASGTMQVLEPGAGVTFAPATLAGASTPGGLAFTLTPHCPACDLDTPGIAGGPVSASIGGVPGTLRLDGATLAIDTAIAADVVELHATGDTTQTAAGVITAGTLEGTAGYAATLLANSLPTYDATTVAPATVALDTAANNVSALGPYYAGGDIRLNDTGLIANGPALTASGTIAPSQRLTVDDRVVAGGAAPATAGITLTAAGVTVDAGAGDAGLLSFGTVSGGAFVTQTRPVTPGAGTFTASTVPATSTDFDTITLQTDRLQLTSAGTTPIVSAPGGVVAIAPLTAGRTLSIDATRDENTLSLVNAELGTLVTTLGGAAGPQTLRLGSLDGGVTAAAPLDVTAPDGNVYATTIRGPGSLTTAGSIAVNASLDLTNAAGTLALFAQGGMTESGAGAVSIGRGTTTPAVTGAVTGAAGGAIQFAGPNSFDVLINLFAGRGLTVADTVGTAAGRGGMTVLGTVSSGLGNLTLSDTGATAGGVQIGGSIAVGSGATPGTLDATGNALTLTAAQGNDASPAISETANSALRAFQLDGSATTTPIVAGQYNAVLDQSDANAIVQVGTFTAPDGAFRLLAIGSVDVLTSAFPETGPVDLTLAGLISARSVAVTAQSLTVTGQVGACTIDIGGALQGGDITLVASNPTGIPEVISGNTGANIVVNGGTIGGASSTTLLSHTLVENSGLIDGPTITIASTETAPDTATQNGGTIAAVTLLTQNPTISGGPTTTFPTINGTLLVGPSGATPAGQAVTFAGAGAPVSLTLTSVGSIGGTVSATDSLVIAGAGSLTTSGTVFAGGDIRLQVPQNFTQTGGVVAAAGNLVVSGPGGDGVPVGGAITQSGGSLLAGGLAQLYATGNAAQAAGGVLAADNVAVVSLNGTNTFAASNEAAVGGTSQGNLVFVCPGCAPPFPQGPQLVQLALGTGPSRPATVRLDGSVLSLLYPVAADTVELHSVFDTTQASTAIVSAGSLSGTAGYAMIVPSSGLPTYTPDAATAVGGTLALDTAPNVIGRLTSYQARTAFRLNDQPPAGGLSVTGIVQAGLAAEPLTAAALAATGGPLSITLGGANPNLAIVGSANGDAVLAGSLVTLTTPGAITESTGGRIVAATLTGSATNGATLDPGGGPNNQVASLGNFAAPAGGFALVDGTTLTVSGAVTAHDTIRLGVTGDLVISGSLTSSTANGTLTASGAISGSNVSVATTLAADAGTSVTLANVAASVLTGAAGQDFSVAGNFGTMAAVTATAGAATLTDGAALTVAGPVSGQTGVTIQAPTILAAGNVTSPSTIRLRTSSGLTQTGGTIAAGGDLLVTGFTDGTPTGGAIVQQAGTLAAGGTVQLLTAGDAILDGRLQGNTVAATAGGSVTQAATGQIAGATPGGAVTITAGDVATFAGSVSAAAVRLSAGVDLTQAAGASFVASGGTIALDGMTGNVSLGGVLTAPTIVAMAGTTITLGNGTATGSAITTGTTAPPRRVGNIGGANQDNPFPTAQQSPGAFFTAPTFQQSGTTVINNGTAVAAGAIDGTVVISTSQTLAFNNLQAGTTQLYLSLGDGSATGNINVGGLNLLAAALATGGTANGGATLSGTVDGRTGTTAAGIAFIDPAESSKYKMNGCPIQSINCVLLSPLVLPVTNPINDINVGSQRRRRDDQDLILPNVGERDY